MKREKSPQETELQDGLHGGGIGPRGAVENGVKCGKHVYAANPARMQAKIPVLVVSLSMRQRPCGALSPERLETLS